MKPPIIIALGCLLALGFIGCQRTVHVTEQMTWQCVPEEYNPAYYAKPDEYVLFKFVKNEHVEEMESSRDFCAELRQANRPVVNVEFELHGYWHHLHGWQMVSVDGRPLQNIGGWSWVGAKDYSGPSPLDEAFAR